MNDNPYQPGWDEGYAAGLHEANAYPQAWLYGASEERARVLALLDSEAADVHQRALFVMFEAIFDDDDMPAAGDYYRISRAALAAVRQLIAESAAADREKPEPPPVARVGPNATGANEPRPEGGSK